MKRVVLVVVILVSVAEARRVVHIPTMRELCPGNDDWTKVAQCIGRQGSFKIVRDEPKAKLVHVTAQSRLTGLYLYTHDKRWRVSGEMQMDYNHDLLDFRRVTYGKRSGYRIDVGISYAMPLAVDGETTIPGLLRYRFTNLCFDDSRGCMQAITSCDGLVQGKAMFTFRGSLVYENRQLKVVGDRRNAGPYCVQAEFLLSD